MAALDDLPVVVKRHGTLVADTVTTIELGTDVAAARVLNRGGTGADEIWFRVDPGAEEPDVDDEDSDPVLVLSWSTARAPGRDNTVVKLYSEGTPRYTIEGLRA